MRFYTEQMYITFVFLCSAYVNPTQIRIYIDEVEIYIQYEC